MTVCAKKLHLKPLALFLLLLSFNGLLAQRIKNESVVRNIAADHYFRFYYENDFVTIIDYYYTSGMNIELVKPSFQKNPLNKTFFGLPGAKMKFGLALDHYAFTPLYIKSNEILYGDRPYAGCISVNSFRIATNEEKRRRITNSLVLGLIGPATKWEPVQTFLHKHVIAAPQPQGWDHQIANDFILNYKVNIEKNLIGEDGFLVNGNAEAVVGTMNDKLSAGLSLMIGKFNDPYSSAMLSDTKWQLYVFGQSFVSAVGYDATLQGGVLNEESPYTLDGSEINRFTLQNQVGLILRHTNISIELSESFLSKEIKSGRSHVWGGLGISIDLK